MERIKNLLRASAFALCALLGAAACSDDDGNGSHAGEALGTYSFDGKEYPIHQAYCERNEGSVSFIFSPLVTLDGQLTSYFCFALADVFTESEVSLDRLYHNDDYIFVYEDPVHYYSRVRKPKGGTAYVSNPEGDRYRVKLDIVLPDGKSFYCDFEGPLGTPKR